MKSSPVMLDAYVIDTLMADLVGHDRKPSAYIAYLALLRLGGASGETAISLQGLATATGLSKSAVQRSIGHLIGRGLLSIQRGSPTDVPRYRCLSPWRR
ncbi:MAG: helix-turn-helix domain-containing protein [Porphyrobacter sp.]|nr:helix-turn-helix domain-containing protein [Porphyrobacter sp.]